MPLERGMRWGGKWSGAGNGLERESPFWEFNIDDNDNCNNKLSTRRRRKISNQLGIPRSNFIVNKKNSHERDLILKNKDYYSSLLGA